jgi:hypothetical protein
VAAVTINNVKAQIQDNKEGIPLTPMSSAAYASPDHGKDEQRGRQGSGSLHNVVISKCIFHIEKIIITSRTSSSSSPSSPPRSRSRSPSEDEVKAVAESCRRRHK